MNFLAHLYLVRLTDSSPEAAVGSLMPDLVRGKLPADLPPATRAAVEQHRRIDAFTDTHALFARSKARLAPRHGRYAGIITDVLYDHFLARDWRRYAAQDLPLFVREAHAALSARADLLPAGMRYAVERMVEQDWLGGYATRAGIEAALRRMSLRLSQRFERPVCLESAMDDLGRLDAELAADFAAFFPEVAAFARRP